MSKRPFDPDKLTNELSGASSFFRPQTPTPAPAEQPVASTPPAAASSSAETRSPVRPVRVGKRHMIRHAFELYLDQLERLRLAAQIEREEGGAGSMSKMVREAIDRYLEEHPPVAQ